MERVFHFSDFHISPEIGEPSKNSHFQLLLSSLSPYCNSQNYIVYTGDVILYLFDLQKNGFCCHIKWFIIATV